MTFWKTDNRKPGEALIRDTVQIIKKTNLPEGLQETPEWISVEQSVASQDLRVLAVALEVVASHYSKILPADGVELVEAVADSIRHGRVAEMKALVSLMERTAAPRRAA